MSEAKRHHYLPQFYLRRFANQKEHLTAYRRDTGKTIRVSTRNAAVEAGLYTVPGPDGAPSNALEEALGTVEGQAAAVLRRIDQGVFPPNADDRITLSMFIAVQMVRTRESMHRQQEMGEIAIKSGLYGFLEGEEGVVSREGPITPEFVEEHRIVPSPAHIFGDGLQLAMEELAPRLHSMAWNLLSADRRVFLTSDAPVALWETNPQPHRGVGVGTADEISFPLDSRKTLLLSRDHQYGELSLSISRSGAKEINRRVATQSYEWVFCDPRVDLLKGIQISRSRPLFSMNGKSIHRGEGWKAFKEFLDGVADEPFEQQPGDGSATKIPE